MPTEQPQERGTARLANLDNGPELVAEAVRGSFHRAGRPLGERLYRELQWEAQG